MTLHPQVGGHFSSSWGECWALGATPTARSWGQGFRDSPGHHVGREAADLGGKAESCADS